MSANKSRDLLIYVDADACPVKNEIERVAHRHGLKVFMVSDGGVRPSQNPLIEIVVVTQGADAADDWIVEHIQKSDICITSDILLAGRCLGRNAFVLKPNGQAFSHDNIGTALATREILQNLRDSGELTGGPKPFSKSDRSEFLNQLETTVQAAKREII